jgi:outer membrane protein assembly factor BamB
LFGLLLLVIIAMGADWTRFRGPQGMGTSDEKGLPAKWSAKENVVWRTELPGPGGSSPVTLGNGIYLTCYSGYALDIEEPGDLYKLKRHVLCLDRATGSILWKKDFEPAQPESAYSGNNNTWHGYSSSTPTTDGQHLYFFFGKSGVYALDLNGNEAWHADVGSKATGWGSGNSPVLYKNLLIVNASVESDAMVALDKATGKEVWRVDYLKGARNTPVVVDVADGKSELVVSLPGKVDGAIVAYDPENGKELWRCKGIPDGGYVCPSVIANNGIVYAIGGRKNTALAVRAGGRGEVTESHLLWHVGKGSNVASPVYHNGHIYWLHERQGVAYCLNAETGETVYEKRLEPRPGISYASALVADGKLFYVSQHDGTYVLAAKPEFELLAHNTFADDDNRANASPVVSNGQLIFRNDRYVYCLGKK